MRSNVVCDDGLDEGMERNVETAATLIFMQINDELDLIKLMWVVRYRCDVNDVTFKLPIHYGRRHVHTAHKHTPRNTVHVMQ